MFKGLEGKLGLLTACFAAVAGFFLGWFVFGVLLKEDGSIASGWPAWISAGSALLSALLALWMALHNDKVHAQSRAREVSYIEAGRQAALGIIVDQLYMDMNWVIDVSRAYALAGNGRDKLNRILHKGIDLRLGSPTAEAYYRDLPPAVVRSLSKSCYYQKLVMESFERWICDSKDDNLRYLVHRIERYGQKILLAAKWSAQYSPGTVPAHWLKWRKVSNVDDLRRSYK